MRSTQFRKTLEEPVKSIAALFLLSTLFLLACSTSSQVDLKEPKRVLGLENDVRIDAQLSADRMAPNSLVGVTYEIENLRNEPIALADLIPEITYENDSRTITINLGAEVPGNQIVPRLVRISSGEKKSFTTSARMNLVMPATAGPFVAYPQLLRLKVNFLGNVQPFEKLIDIPERAISDAKLADSMFATWIENNEAVVTNAIPIRWGATEGFGEPPPQEPSRRGRRGRRPGSPF